jgi:hypothetical protein
MPYIIFLLFWWVINCQTAAQSLYDERGESKYGYTPVRKGQLWGVLDSTNRLVAACQYKNAQVVTFGCDITGLLLDGDYCFIGKDSLRCYQQLYGYENGYARASKNGLQGYVDKNGIEILPCEYGIAYVKSKINRLIISKKNEKKGIIALNPPRIIVPTVYDYIGFQDNKDKVFYNKFWANKDNKQGVIDSNGQVIIPFEHQCLIWWDGMKLIVLDDSTNEVQKIGVCDTAYNFLLPMGEYTVSKSKFQQDEMRQLSDEKFIIIQKKGKYGMLNRNFETIIPFEYDNIKWHGDYRIMVQIDGKVGLVDTNYKWILPVEYDNFLWVNDRHRFMLVYKNKKRGIIDLNGKTILPIEYEQINNRFNNTYYVKKNNKCGLFDSDFQEILPAIYDEIISLQEEILVRQGKKWGFLKERNLVWLPKGETYTNLIPLGNAKLLVVQQKQQNGEIISAIIDTKGKMILPFSKKMAIIASIYHQNNVIVSQKNKEGRLLYGIAKINGDIVIKPQYDSIKSTVDFFFIWKNNKKGLINLKNEWLIPPIYDNIVYGMTDIPEKKRYYLVYNNQKVGVLDNNYQLIVPIIYDNIIKKYHDSKILEKGYFIVMKDNKRGIVDGQGKELVPPVLTYTHIVQREDGYFDINNYGNYTCACTVCYIEKGLWGILSPKGKLIREPCSNSTIKKMGNVFVSTKNIYLTQENTNVDKNTKNKQEEQPIRTIEILMDSTGKIIKEYDKVYVTKHKTAMVQIGQKVGAIDENGKEIIPLVLDDIRNGIEHSRYSFHIVARNGKWGVLDSTIKWVVEPQYSDILLGEPDPYDYLPQNMLKYCVGRVVDVCEKRETVHGKWGVMTTKGKILTPPLYKEVIGFYDGYSKVTIDGDPDDEYKGDLYGLIDSTGKTIMPTMYRYIATFDNSLSKETSYRKAKKTSFIVATTPNDKKGMFYLDGKTIIPCRFNGFTTVKPELALFTTNDSIYVINNKGHRIGAYQYSIDTLRHIQHFDDKLFIRKDSIVTMFYLKKHKKISFSIPTGYRVNHYVSKKNLVIIANENNMGVMNIKGKIIIPYQRQYISIDEKRRILVQEIKNEKISYNFKGKKTRKLVNNQKL